MSSLIKAVTAAALLGTLPVSPAWGDSMVAFVTSVTGTGDLSSWADAGGETGLGAGDAICQARAAAAGLANPASFVAWLSDSSDDAYCRVHGFSGKKSNACGQPELPTWAGPWIRTDGYPFAETIDLVTGWERAVLTPLSLDEFGAAAAADIVFTGTTSEGEVSSSTPLPCSDWTDSSSASVTAGRTNMTGDRWSNNGTAGCHAPSPLFCLQSGNGSSLPSLPRNGGLAFLTSVSGKGRLQDWPEAGGATGLEAGDAICRARAAAAGYATPDQFMAWLSNAQEDAADRFTFGGPWVRPDGVPVASSLADLTDGELFAPINLSELGYYDGAQWAWTGSWESGLATSQDCDGWASDSDTYSGTRGFAIDNHASWTDSWDEPCDGNRSLYCFAQAPDTTIIFSGDFEGGDTSAWSDVFP